MKRTAVIISFVICFVLMLLFSSFLNLFSYAQDTEYSFHGEIYDIDPDVSMVIVKRTMSKLAESFEEVNCFIDSETKITKNGNEVEMDELFPGDNVYVELTANPEGQKVTILIQVIDKK
ncbi:MAG: hypothetical protein PHY73_01600 [Candidatus Omnitrophica bacterium]|nr:hypothetical protein [Candidatus Omnitrophota bacterium]